MPQQTLDDIYSSVAAKPSLDDLYSAHGGGAPTSNEVKVDSYATQGLGYLLQHPFKSIFDGLSKTITGKTMSDIAMNNAGSGGAMSSQQAEDYKNQWGQYPDFYKADPSNKLVQMGMYADKALTGMIGSVGDMATSPASYIPIPGLSKVGKIPVGSTNLGRIASNVAVGNGFKKGVGELQALESHLQDIGKLSSPGIRIGADYNPAVNESILAAHNYIAKPTASQFKGKPGNIDNYNKKIIEGYKVLNDMVGTNKPRSLQDALDASSDALNDIYGAYTSQAKNASLEGAKIDIGKVGKQALDPIINNPQAKTYSKSLIPQVKDIIASLENRGNISIEEAQKDVEALSSDVGKYLRSGSVDDQNMGAVKLALSQAIRKKADSTIEETLGRGGYQDLRNKYSAVRTLQEGLTKSAAQQMKQPGGISHPILDVMSGVDLGSALIKASTGDFVGAGKDALSALLLQGVKKGRDVLVSPDRKIQNIFNILSNAKKTPRPNPIANMVFNNKPARESFRPVSAELVEPPTAPLGLPSPQQNMQLTGPTPLLGLAGPRPFGAPALPKPDIVHGDNFTMRGLPRNGSLARPIARNPKKK